jgi:hypothetical protein
MAKTASPTPGLAPSPAAFYAEQPLPDPSGRAAQLREVLQNRPSSGLDAWDPSGRAAELLEAQQRRPSNGAFEDLQGRHLLASFEVLHGGPPYSVTALTGHAAELHEVRHGRPQNRADDADTVQVPVQGLPRCPQEAWGNKVSNANVQAPANVPPHRSQALPAGRPSHSLSGGRNEVSNPGDFLCGEHRNGTTAGHSCGKQTPLHDDARTVVPKYSQYAQHRNDGVGLAPSGVQYSADPLSSAGSGASRSLDGHNYDRDIARKEVEIAQAEQKT